MGVVHWGTTTCEKRMATDQKFFDELGAKIREMLADSPARDIEKNLRAMLTAAFARLDLVTREEFDVQSEVLARAREQLARLEARLAELEKTQSSAQGGEEQL